MKFVTLTAKEFDKFALSHPLANTYQTSMWGELKRSNGWLPHYVGLRKEKKLIAATLLLEKPTPIRKSLFYAPRGFLIDFENKTLLNRFTNEIKNYIKDSRGFMLKLDPNYIYQIRDNEGHECNPKNDKVMRTLKELGYKHFGFNKNFETMQPRFLCRFRLQNTYEQVLNTFYKSTKRNIEIAFERCVKVRTAKIDEMDLVMDLLDETASRKNLVLRTSNYYHMMFDLFKDYSLVYIAYIDTQEYLSKIENKWVDAQKEKEQINNKMKKEIVGKSLKKQLELVNQKLNKLNDEIKYAKSLIKISPELNIGALYATYVGSEGITFMSGINDDYRKFNPKYALYSAHIKETLKRKMTFVNFYGISGDVNPKNKYYGIYELKKGFNTEIVELLGEYDLVVNKLDYIIYKIALKIYFKAKKMKH